LVLTHDHLISVLFQNFSILKAVTHKAVCTNVDLNLIADQHNFRVKYLQNSEETELKNRSVSFQLLQYHVMFHLYWFN